MILSIFFHYELVLDWFFDWFLSKADVVVYLDY